ncbi:MAG: GNAT family N-acetyltransferase [Candidatus Bipolaricaulota bacterium]|nr:GNAT family N-acetyltransferase [Candidatus Bipolaricaulota bacterium]
MSQTHDHRYLIEPFDKNCHNRSAFACGVEPLDLYLQKQIDQDLKRKIAAPFVLLEVGQLKVGQLKVGQLEVLGYYTLSAFSVHLGKLPLDVTNRLPRYPDVPATLLGRLAVDQTFRGKGLGEFLLMDALHRSLKQTGKIAFFAVVVDTVNEDARTFYLHFGFSPFSDRADRLFLPMKTIEKLF